MFDPILARVGTEAVADFRDRHPSAPLIIYSSYEGYPAQAVLELACCGVTRALTYGVDDDSVSFLAAIREVLGASRQGRTFQYVWELTPPDFRGMLAHLWDHAAEDGVLDALARKSCCHPKTMRVRFTRAGLPPPGRLAMWCRLLQASLLLHSQRSVSSAAYGVGYSSSAVLYRQLRRVAGLSPADLRREDGIDRLLAAFAAEIQSGPRIDPLTRSR